MNPAQAAEAAFHPGECALQERFGTRERAAAAGTRAFRDHLTEPQRAFFAGLPFVAVAALDDDGRPWAGLLAGAPGFVSAPTPAHVEIATGPADGDPVAPLLGAGRPVGLLGLDQAARRRHRVNGVVAGRTAERIIVAVRQSFGNCPKYITRREVRHVGPSCAAAPPRRGDELDADARGMIAAADTFFIATAHPEAGTGGGTARGADVSHRGGPAGFVRVEADGGLAVPDFAGNGYFNTLGNLELNPRAGLLFVDFEAGSLLHVAVDAEPVCEAPRPAQPDEAPRLLRLTPRGFVLREGVLPLRWGPASEG